MTDTRVALSAAALGITDAEYKALLEIRGLFANGTFHHDPAGEADLPNGFNMNFSWLVLKFRILVRATVPD